MQEVLKKMVQVGDVIMSPDFIVCCRVEDGRLWVGKPYGDNPVSDQSRAEAKYAVEEVSYVPEDEYNGACWRVEARRLNEDGSYDPEGEAIAFHMRSDYTSPFIDEVAVVGKLKRIISFVKQD